MSAGTSAKGARPTTEQRRAADPARSVWVDANAGTGKTRVLTDRVLRLLLAGAAPSSLLCLTYTKAAAGEMLARIGHRLARWSTLDDASLTAELEAIADEAPSRHRLRRARSLHDAVLALPSGLAIMTVHGLGQHLLRRFPIEAGVAASFEVIDERTRAELMADARDQVLSLSAQVPELASDLAILAGRAADRTILDAVDALIGARLDWVAARDAQGGTQAAVAAAGAVLGVEDWRGTAATIAAACRDEAFDRDGLAAAATVLAAARQKTRQKAAAEIGRWLETSPTARPALLTAYTKALATADKNGQPGRLRALKLLDLDGLAAEGPQVARDLEAEISRLDVLYNGLNAGRTFERTAALLRLADRVLEAFEASKRQRAALDFDDLLLKTKALLERPGAGAWVRYKLDQSFTHILVDEAQDTNPLQWSIIETLLDEVFAGAGTKHAGGRTLFVVGDAKQSIFRFQGADPDASAGIRARIERRAEAAQAPIDRVALTMSFRSSQAVLDVADALLAPADVADRLGPSPPHRAFGASRGGRVELWPLVPPPEAEPPSDAWAVPPRASAPDRAERGLADEIARQVRAWLDAGRTLPATGRPLAAGDVMVLLRRREPMQDLLVRALKRASVPVMGADRLALTSHLAVQDLIALGEAVLLPENDFALACVLKSPLFGFDDEQLFRIAHGRNEGQSLHERWRLGARDDAGLAAAWDRFRYWQRLADFVPAYEFYLRVLGGEVTGGSPQSAGPPAFASRRAILRRFGNEAQEAIEAFIEQSLAYEKGHAATLQGFLHWLALGEATLKREAETGADGVRILTVHGAKGLEAPVVILADAGPKSEAKRGTLLWYAQPAIPLWRPSAGEGVDATAAAVARETEALAADDLRLLYVAATRAAEWLVVAGAEPRRSPRSASWHDRFKAALESLGATTEPAAGHARGEALVYATGLRAPAPAPVERPSASPPMPACLALRAPPPRAREVLRPSDGGSPERPDSRSSSGRRSAMRVGTHVHRLLEHLPALDAGVRRSQALDAYLDGASDLDPALRERVRDHVQHVLDEPRLAPLFAAGSWVEQPVVGEVDGRRIAGQVDRMAVTGDELWIADFKSGRAPAAMAAPSSSHVRQLAAYAALLRPLFPDHSVRAAVIWTETGDVQVLDSSDLALHMPATID